MCPAPIPAAPTDHAARASILTALADGTAREAGELAEIAGLPRAATAAQLALLTEAGLLAEEREGRQRYFSLAEAGLAAMLEGLAGRADAPAPPRRRRANRGMGFARSCHEHLAGDLAVILAEALIAERSLRPGEDRTLLVTRAGRGRFQAVFALDPDSLTPGRHGTACRCPDWGAGRWHLGGPLGQWVLQRMEQAGWVTRAPESRAVGLTEAGARALGRHFGLKLAATG